MPGINATASSKVHTAASANDTASGFVTGESIVLTAAPAGTNYTWAVSLPSGSSAARVGVAGEDEASASFTPDVAGVYAISAVVDGASYTLLLSAVSLVLTNAVQGVRLSPVANAQVPAPPTGLTLFFSTDENSLAVKDSDGDVFTVDVTAT